MTSETDLIPLYKERLKNRDSIILQLVAITQFKLGNEKNDPVKVRQALRDLFLKFLKQYTANCERDKRVLPQHEICHFTFQKKELNDLFSSHF
jgi:hypothetical protein